MDDLPPTLSYQSFQQPGRHALARVVLPPLMPLVCLLVVMELVVRVGLIKRYFLPPPSEVVQTLFDDRLELLQAMWKTTAAAFIGFALSSALGLLMGIILSSAGWVRRAFYPYAIFFQTVPIIAIAPLLVIWFGYGMKTVIASAFIVSVFPVIANTLTGLLSTDPALNDLFRLYGAGPIESLWKLRLPSALPNILTGLRIAAGLAVIGAIVGEFIGGSGLGSIVDVARTQQRTDKVFAAVLLASLLGLILFALVNLASRIMLRHWHASEKNK